MTREEVRNEILKVNSPNILCELPTSFGKSKIALDIMAQRASLTTKELHVLVVIPRLVLIDNWKEEFKRWGYEKYLMQTEFVTYMSLPKKLTLKNRWNVIIFDECHHLSARCRDAWTEANNGTKESVSQTNILLSATVTKSLKEELESLFPQLYTYKVSTKKAITEEILPDPKVYLIPLSLDNIDVTWEIIKNPRQKIELVIPYSQKWKYAKVKNRRIIIKCTQKQYYEDMSSMINWYKKKAYQKIYKNLFLRKSGERLKWLSNQKTAIVNQILSALSEQRTLTFCNGIPQTEELGKYCINSKNKASKSNLAKFNEGKVNHITACNMLDEGMNLANCRIGVYAMLNASERLITQKLGRILRHPNPIIIIPYFKGTREAEIKYSMLENYNPELVKEITDLTNLKEQLDL